MIRKPKKISTFDTRFLVFSVFAISLYHYGVKFILIDAQYILRAPYVAVSEFMTRFTKFLPTPQNPVTCPTPERTALSTYLPSASVPVLQYFDTGYARTLFIPKHNFNIGDIVTSGNCLIGRITKTGKQIASVQLITDQASCIPVVFLGINGIASGAGQQTIQINRLQKTLTIYPSKTPVYTSGIDGVYPKNLLVGFIMRTKHDKAVAQSCFDFKTLSYVEVIAYGHT